jgi:hypothetical protein
MSIPALARTNSDMIHNAITPRLSVAFEAHIDPLPRCSARNLSDHGASTIWCAICG